MNRASLRHIHAIASFTGFAFIAAFWTSSVFTEWFLSQQAVAILKQSIVYAFIIFIPAMMIAGISGNLLAGRSQNPRLAAKRRRMPKIALNGLFILLPCAFYLNHLAQAGQFGGTFYAVQILELLAGAVNLGLMGLNIRDAFALRRSKFS